MPCFNTFNLPLENGKRNDKNVVATVNFEKPIHVCQEEKKIPFQHPHRHTTCHFAMLDS
jgi:hypothetical protein